MALPHPLRPTLLLMLALPTYAGDLESVPSSRWTRDFSLSARDSALPMPVAALEAEGIGKKERVHGLFDRWKLHQGVTNWRGLAWAEVTRECKGQVELDFALTPADWNDSERKAAYYRAVDALIQKTGEAVLEDFGAELAGQEREEFLRALRALAWQESRWQHYLRYKDWFFVFLSGGSYNQLDDWGVTQVARSGFSAASTLNRGFFAAKGHCSIGSTFYYGFLEYWFAYQEARAQRCNLAGPRDKLVGAYNKYASGFSACRWGLSGNERMKKYQLDTMSAFEGHFLAQPWKALNK